MMQDNERDALDMEQILEEFHQEDEGEMTQDMDALLQEFKEIYHLDDAVVLEPTLPDETLAEPVGDETKAFTPVEDDIEQILSVEDETRAFSPVGDETRAFKPVENPEEDIRVFVSGELEKEESGVTGDTIRLDTIEIDPEVISAPKGAATREEEADPVMQEAFTTTWEPEYEQPMGEYVAPRLITFQPRSRLRELKRKLIDGPEKQYYKLVEKGMGKLQAAIFFGVLVSALCVGATVMHTLGMVQPNRLRLMVFVQFLGLLVSALLGSNQMIEGVADVFRKRFTLNTLLVVNFLACCADGVLCLRQQRIPCCGAFSVQVVMSLWSAYQRRYTELGQMDTMRKAVRLDKLSACPDYYEGKPGLVRGEGQVEDFMDTYQAVSKPEKILSWYCLAALVAAVAFGGIAALFNGISAGIQVVAVSLLAASPATIFITLSRPHAILEKRLHKLGTVLCGWQGIQGLKGKLVFPLNGQDVYPAGSVRMNGVKFFGSRNTDDVVAYAAAVVGATDSGLGPVFQHLLESRNGIHYIPQSVRLEEGGVIGSIDDEEVLVGSLAFMRRMDVEVPEGAKVPYAVCIAIGGEFCGLFAINYDKVRDSAAGMATLSAYRGLESIMVGRDFVLTEGFIRKRFGIKTKRMIFPEGDVRGELLVKKPEEETPALLLVTSGGLAPYAYGVTGARALRRASFVGTIVHMVGGILGLMMMLTLVLLGHLELLTPANMLAYQLVWMIPGLLITEWTRSI